MSVLRCRECGTVLKQWPFTSNHVDYNYGIRREVPLIHLAPGFRWARRNMNINHNWYREEIYEPYKGLCPKCGRQLRTPEEYRKYLTVEVKVAEVKKDE